MTGQITKASVSRSQEIRLKAKQYKLLFVHLGAVFEVLRGDLTSELGGTRMTAAEFCQTEPDQMQADGLLVLTDVEEFASSTSQGRPTLGRLRQRVTQQLTSTDVCLLSRVPRIAFPRVPGSSLIDDAKVHCLPLLQPHEQPSEPTTNESMLPAVALGHQDYSDVFRASLLELGLSTLAALDHAIFESMSGRAFIDQLDHSELEALRGSGLVVVQDADQVFPVPQRFSEFREAVAGALADITYPQTELGDVVSGLWTIERVIRKALREAAVHQHKGGWRKKITHGDLAIKVLQRAKGDAYLTATNISELRDPIEWLSLGELLEVVRSKNFGGLGVDDYTWQRFNHELVPIRNRLSHMRLIKNRDKATVTMWVSRITRLLQSS